MDTRVRNVAAASLASLVVFGGMGSTAAHAYPPGKKITVQTNKVKYNRGQQVKARAGRVQAGCRVRFTYTGNGFKKFTETRANRRGKAKSRIRFGPTVKGKYKITVRTIRTSKCKGDKSVTTFRVR